MTMTLDLDDAAARIRRTLLSSAILLPLRAKAAQRLPAAHLFGGVSPCSSRIRPSRARRARQRSERLRPLTGRDNGSEPTGNASTWAAARAGWLSLPAARMLYEFPRFDLQRIGDAPENGDGHRCLSALNLAGTASAESSAVG
jgi:hypothetical protein